MVSFGRGHDRTFTLTGNEISRKHFALYRGLNIDAEVFCKDTSTNGTFINNQRIEKQTAHILAHDDVLQLANRTEIVEPLIWKVHLGPLTLDQIQSPHAAAGHTISEEAKVAEKVRLREEDSWGEPCNVLPNHHKQHNANCKACGVDKTKDQYTKSQWRKTTTEPTCIPCNIKAGLHIPRQGGCKGKNTPKKQKGGKKGKKGGKKGKKGGKKCGPTWP